MASLFRSPGCSQGKGLSAVVPLVAMLGPRDQSWGESARQGLRRAHPGWQWLPALSLSLVSGSPRAWGLADFPENIDHCLRGLCWSPGPPLRPWSDPGSPVSCPAPTPRQQSRLPGLGKPPSDGDPRPSPLALLWRGGLGGSWSPSQASGAIPGTGDPKGCVWPHSEWEASLWRAQKKDFVFRVEDRARATSPSLMSEWIQNGPSPPCLSRAGGTGSASLRPLIAAPTPGPNAACVCLEVAFGEDFLHSRSDHSEQKACFSWRVVGAACCWEARLTLRCVGSEKAG